jgi:thioredoxin reductase
MYDVIIVGGGPAGLSAALILGRARRTVLVCDDARYRNEASRGLHGFLSRDGMHPAELRRIGREQLDRYEVEYRNVRVSEARAASPQRFEVTLDDGVRLECRRLLLATGVLDHVPAIDGFERFYGSSVFHCPYCDGWEMRDQPLAVYGHGSNAAGLSRALLTWSSDIVLCTDGPTGLKPDDATGLHALGIAVRSEKILRLEGSEYLEQIVFGEGAALPRRGLFLSTGQEQRCDLARILGCRFTRKGAVQTGKLEGTNIPGLFVAGDASKDVQLAIVAAAEGAKAGIAINTSLQEEDGR